MPNVPVLKGLEQKLKSEGTSADLVQVYMTETKRSWTRLPDLVAKAGDEIQCP